MTEERDLLNFVRQINADIRDLASGGSVDGAVDFKENVFTRLVQDWFAETGMVENPEVCYYEARVGRGMAKVNGFGVNDDEDTLDIFTSIFHDTAGIVSVPKEEISKAARRAARFLEAATQGLHKNMETASDAYAMASRIYELTGRFERVRIFIITDGRAPMKMITNLIVRQIPVSFEIWDLERLCRSMHSGLPHAAIEIDFEKISGKALPCLPMPEQASDYMAYLTIFPGEVLYKLYEEYGSRLLELNIRSFLQARGKVNRGIRDTLRSEPDRFMAYNNGISITVGSLETVRLPDGQPAIKSVHDLQIVNGGQTTASIYRARKYDRADIGHVFIPAKITVVESAKLEEMVRNISLCANTQNVIQMADFSANEPFHVEIERLSSRIWCTGEQGHWFYERARGQYQVAKLRFGATVARKRKFNEQTPPARRFTKTDLAKYIQSWEQLPHIVSRGAQKSFVIFMQELSGKLGKDWLPDENYYKFLIAKAIVFRTTQKIVRQEKFPAYQANIITYLVAYLSLRAGEKIDLEQIWREQTLSKSLIELLRGWSHKINMCILSSASGRNVTEWCKKEDCWKAVKRLQLPWPHSVPSELRYLLNYEVSK